MKCKICGQTEGYFQHNPPLIHAGDHLFQPVDEKKCPKCGRPDCTSMDSTGLCGGGEAFDPENPTLKCQVINLSPKSKEPKAIEYLREIAGIAKSEITYQPSGYTRIYDISMKALTDPETKYYAVADIEKALAEYGERFWATNTTKEILVHLKDSIEGRAYGQLKA